ncbi:MAG: ribosome-associated translation inhibitor RaiA [Abditibacteriota bacterium]|nr:ribosome-associated translation inhibitor RaiA [Abditibacteriota bacterium]
MEVKVKGKNLTVAPGFQEYLEKKLAKLERHFSKIKSADALLTKNRDTYTLEVTLEGDNVILRGEQKNCPDTRACVDEVIDKLDSQANRFKGKKYGRKKNLGKKKRDEEKENIYIQNTENPGVVKTKAFEMPPMSVEDAVENMELGSHTFYMFLNEETGKYTVIYKRADDDDYGIIEPK